jgi:Domain of unknown function (DUF4340)
MQSRKTFLALLVLVIIGGFAYYVSRQPEAQKNYKLFNLAPAEIARIELHGPARDLVVERTALGLWRIVKPVATAADNRAVDAVANAIANLEVVDTVDTGAETAAELANFGLENPAVTVTVTTADKRVLPGIMVGMDTPIGSNTYIKTTDKPAVLLIGAGFTAESGRTLNDLRSHVLIDLTADQMNHVAVTHADGSTIEIARQGDDWKIIQPRQYPADKTAVQQLLDAIAGARVAEFVLENPDDLNKFGLAHPALQLEVSGGKGNAKHSVAIGFKQPEAAKSAVFVRLGEGDRPVCTIADYVVKAVDKSFNDLRDKTVLAFDEAKVARMTLIGGPVSMVLERGSGGKWNVIAEGKTVPAKPEVAASMLDQLHELKGTRIVEDPMTDPQPFGMVHPTLTAVLYDHGGKEIGSIYLSQIEATTQPDAATGKSATRTFGYATSSTDKAVYEVLPAQVVDLENTASTLKGASELKSATPANPTRAASPAPMGTVAPPVAAPATS